MQIKIIMFQLPLWLKCNHFSSSPLRSSMPAEMTMLADHPARQLLDFSQKLDINLLDNVVNSMYHDIGSQVRSQSPPLVGCIFFRNKNYAASIGAQ